RITAVWQNGGFSAKFNGSSSIKLFYETEHLCFEFRHFAKLQNVGGNLHRHYTNIMNWIEDKELITQKYFEVINLNNLELIAIIRDNYEQMKKIFPLVEFILTRLETVMTLAIDERIWDAEIILRSALETFVKYVFITSAEADEQLNRIDEYWNSLAEINSLKLSEQAKKNLKHFGNSEIHRVAYLPLILPEELETELRGKWTKAERQKVEQKWSFTEMVNSISNAYHGKPLEIIITLTH
ncbi:MAG: hypothetical protein WA749_16845, partial [Gelidibacter sp.]